MAYKLKTLKNGALVREYPQGYSVWCGDETSTDGYRLLKAYEAEPPREAVNELFDGLFPDPETVSGNPGGGIKLPTPVASVATSVTSFFKGLSKL